MSSASLEDADEIRVYDATESLELLGLTGVKTERWLNEMSRLQRIPCTPFGRVRRWSKQNLRDAVRLLNQPARNKIR